LHACIIAMHKCQTIASDEFSNTRGYCVHQVYSARLTPPAPRVSSKFASQYASGRRVKLENSNR
jgi:hypothetical protein